MLDQMLFTNKEPKMRKLLLAAVATSTLLTTAYNTVKGEGKVIN
jgi:predicted small secreted protein